MNNNINGNNLDQYTKCVFRFETKNKDNDTYYQVEEIKGNVFDRLDQLNHCSTNDDKSIWTTKWRKEYSNQEWTLCMLYYEKIDLLILTLYLMKIHGVNFVRGSDFPVVINIQKISDVIRDLFKLCYNCGGDDHYKGKIDSCQCKNHYQAENNSNNKNELIEKSKLGYQEILKLLNKNYINKVNLLKAENEILSNDNKLKDEELKSLKPENEVFKNRLSKIYLLAAKSVKAPKKIKKKNLKGTVPNNDSYKEC